MPVYRVAGPVYTNSIRSDKSLTKDLINIMSQPVILVDGSSYLFRAFHAIPLLTNSKGLYTNAIKGVISMIKRLQKDYPQSEVVVVFDAKGKTFRNDMYGEYKANRPPMPEELREQIEPIHNIIRAMGLPLLIVEGVEADDVIGTLAAQATELKREVIVSTGDKDMAQLVNEHVSLINTMTDTFMDVEGVKEKFGIGPEFIIDYLALMGDKVDNIPGVPKVGEKTAVGLIAGLGSLEDVYANLDEVKTLSFRGAKTLAPRLEEHKEQAFLSKQLATIKCDVELEKPLQEWVATAADNDKLLEIFQHFEFKAWTAELSGGADKSSTGGSAVSAGASVSSHVEGDDDELPAKIEGDYDVIFDQAELDSWLETLKASELFAFDTETTSLNYKDAEIVGVSFSVEAGKAAYVPLAHDDDCLPEGKTQLDRAAVLAQLKPVLEDENQKKVGQHMKYDMHVLANYDIHLKGVAFDTQLESYVLNSVATRHDMDSLALKYLGHKCISFEDVAGKGAKQKTFNQIHIDVAGPYAAEDADITLRLHQTLWPKLQREESLSKVFSDIEMGAMPVLFGMEETGALIDGDLLHQQSAEIEQKLQQLEQQAHDVAGEVFNLASPKQLGVILFEKLELPVRKKTPKGAPSTAEEVLVELAEEFELPRIIIEHRGLAKLKSTYTDKLPLMVNGRSGRVHTSYHQAVAATGRLSSTDPNLQNIPVKSEEGRRIRQAFVAPEGYKLVAADYSQVELRIMAHLSDDEGLLNAFNDGRDVHRATAAEVFGVSEDEVTDNQRRSAKAINFGLIYGMSAFGLAKQLGIGRGEAQDYVNLYFQRYPGVQAYMDNTRENAKEKGYVETIFGRRLYLPDIRAKNAPRRQHAERTAINAPMQGTAADIIKRAMIQVADWLPESGFDARMLMQVHDELILEVREDQAEAFAAELQQKMQDAAEIKVPLLVEAGIGDNWDQAH